MSESGPRTYVVFHRGAWFTTTVPGDTPQSVGVEQLVGILDRAALDRGADTLRSQRDPATAMAAAPSWVGLLDDGLLVVEADDGTTHRLDATAVEFIDALAPPAPLAEVAERLGWTAPDTATLIDRLGPRFVRHMSDDTGSDDTGSDEVEAVGGTRPGVSPTPPAAPAFDATSVESDASRIPLYSIWHDRVGPMLAPGMLSAAARHHDGGSLNTLYDIRRPEPASSFLDHLATVKGPAILLCSDYLWTLEDNLEAARRGLAINPDLIVVHGGPSCPKYLEDARSFLERYGPAADILVRGEGEHVLCQLLEAIRPTLPALDADALREVPGLTFIDARTSDLVRTEDQPRIADLDALPSPYLTGEFDHIPPEIWQPCLTIETNRGCPYGCAFCDWGSSTMSRIRKFSLERVAAELEWAAERAIWSINVADANFGIMSRDVEIAGFIASAASRHEGPRLVNYYPAKNTTKHLARIMDVLLDAGVGPVATLSLQTTDPETLEIINRENISTDHYVRLTAEFRRRGLPLQGELLLGLPGQTYDAYRRDLQHHIDHEVTARTWQVRVLPNAPINDPEYRRTHAIEVDGAHRVMSTTHFDAADRTRMMRLRNVEIIAERFGLLRHLMRYLQWDHGIEASLVLDRLIDLVEDQPTRFPTLTWTLNHFDLFQCTAVGWARFYDEVTDFVVEEYGIAHDSALATVMSVQRVLMAEPGRTFPVRVELPHDYVGYYRQATGELYRSGHATGAAQPLHTWGPGVLDVDGDPLGLCSEGLEIVDDPRDELFANDFVIGANSAFELASPLMRLMPHVAFAARDAYEALVRAATEDASAAGSPVVLSGRALAAIAENVGEQGL